MKLVQRIGLEYYRIKLKALEVISPVKAAEAAFELLCTPYTRKRTYDPPPIFKEGQKQNLSFEGHRIHGYLWKPKLANGHRILICHGFDSASYKFEKYIRPLIDEGFEVLAFDAPAHGLSTGKTINVLLYRNFILQVIKAYGPIAGLMAHSFGGTAAALAVEHLGDGKIKRLVLIAPATETTTSVNDFCRVLRIGPPLKAELEALMQRIGGNPIDWYSVSRAVQNIHTPTLWLHDRFDKITPYTDMQHLQEKWLPHVKFYITEHLGHSLYMDNKVAEEILNFLRELKKA